MSDSHVHGYQPRENERLRDQAGALADLLHDDTYYGAGSMVLEAGCGVGAQAVLLARRSGGARFVSVDRSASSIADARRRAESAGLTNVAFAEADILALPFIPGSFDHVFVCFVLEHLARPVDALAVLRTMLKPGGTITAIEGDHGSAFFHPASQAAAAAINALVRLQRQAGGDPLIGRRLYPLLVQAGFDEVASPRMVYADPSRPVLVDGFTEKTSTAMVGGVRERPPQPGSSILPPSMPGYAICGERRTECSATPSSALSERHPTPRRTSGCRSSQGSTPQRRRSRPARRCEGRAPTHLRGSRPERAQTAGGCRSAGR